MCDQFQNYRQTPDSYLGISNDEVYLVNPITGEPIPIIHQRVTMVDPRTGNVVVVSRRSAIQCSYGDLIPEGESLAFCHFDGGAPVCRLHSVVDPFCGGIYCLIHSRIVEVDGIIFRVCFDCYRRLREGLLKRTVRKIFGRE